MALIPVIMVCLSFLLLLSSGCGQSKLEKLLDEGITLLDSGQYEEALVKFDLALEIDPEHAKTHYLRGIVYQSRQNFDQSIVDFSKAIKLQDDYTDAYYFRAGSYVMIRDYEAAINDYSKVIEQLPDSSDGYNKRGGLYAATGETQKAIDDLTKSINIEPSFQAYVIRASMYMMERNPIVALTDINFAIELKDSSAVAYKRRSQIYTMLGNTEKAKADSILADSLAMLGKR